MRKLKRLLSRPDLLMLAAFVLQSMMLFRLATPCWDATFYYGYARSVVFDGDLEIGNDLRLSYPTTCSDFAAKAMDQDLTATGRVATPFAIGCGILWLVPLTLLRLVADGSGLVGLGPAAWTGYEWFFVATIAAFSSLCGLMAFWLGYRISRAITGKGSALIAVLTWMFTSPLIYYQFQEPLYSHATSALVNGLCITLWWRWRRRPVDPVRGVMLGAVIGFSGLVRWQHLIYLVLPAISAAWWWFSLSRGERRPATKRVVIYLGLTVTGALLLFSLQFAFWQIYFGRWLTVPQGTAFLDWSASFVVPLLFSSFRGLFTWMPAALPALLGLVLLGRQRPRLAVPLAAVLLLEIFVNASTPDWFAGGGFGPRRFASELVIFIIGYAALLQALQPRWRQWVGAILGVLLAWQQWVLLRYGLFERIGGQVRSMAPLFEWSEVSLALFLSQIGGHLSDLWLRPAEFFVMPNTPLARMLNGDYWPGRELVGFLAAGLLLALGWRLGRWLLPRFESRPATRRGVLATMVLLVAAADCWVLFWG